MAGGNMITEATCPKCGELEVYATTDTRGACESCRRSCLECRMKFPGHKMDCSRRKL